MQSPRHTENSSTGSQIVAQGDQPQQSPTYTLYPSQQPITRGRYITSNDRRGFLPVWEFTINEQAIMMDMDDGYVLWTTIAKALGKTKGDIQRMIEADPELQTRVRKTKGGYLKTQGTWIPRDSAEGLARKIAWPIRYELIPLFGPTFPDMCLDPSHPDYEQIGKPHQRKRRNTAAAVIASTSAAEVQQRGRSNTSNYTPGTSWLPPTLQRSETMPVPTPYSEVSTRQLIMQPAGIPQSPPGNYSSHRSHTMPTDQRVQYHPYPQQGHLDQRQHSSPSHTPSPTHTAAEPIAYTPYEQPYQQQQPVTYASNYDSGQVYNTSPPPLHRPPSSQAYYQPQQPAIHHQPQYVTHENSQGYSSHPTTPIHTPTHTEFNTGLSEENYAQHDQTHQQQPYQQQQQPQQQPQQHSSYNSNAYAASYGPPVVNAGTYSPGHTYYPYQPETTATSTPAPIAQGTTYAYSYSAGPAESHVRYSAEDVKYNAPGQINEENQYGTYSGYETGPSTGPGTAMSTGGSYSPPNHQVQQPQQQQIYYDGPSTGYRPAQQSSPQQGEGSYGPQTTYYQYSGMSQ
ncbi:hypothetical protein FRB94_008987 [Tulasnella sp. JGI-2019a]|nr:hypothetical protein FRB93_003484 [Tulasnella sp. JGI-2019a]KAG9014829.1 hypothetical protein FRB94_008987 [Tulasnella sp. JGI-2019a]